jgi:hypothetical protein
MDVNERLERVEAAIAKFRVAIANWQKAEDLIEQLACDLDVFRDFADELGVVHMLIDRVPLHQRFMVDRWFDAARRIEQNIDELDCISIAMADVISDV